MTQSTLFSTAGYDETVRTPLEELPVAFANKVTAAVSRPDMQPCAVDVVNLAWATGDLTPVEVDDYVRTDTTSPQMDAVIEQVKSAAECVPGY